MSNSQLNKLKLAIKSGTEVTLKISSNVAGDSNDEKNVPHVLLLRLRKAFANGLSVNIKLSRFQLQQQMQLFISKCLDQVLQTIENEAKYQKGRFIGMLLGTLKARLLGNLLTGKVIITAGEGTVRAGEDF